MGNSLEIKLYSLICEWSNTHVHNVHFCSTSVEFSIKNAQHLSQPVLNNIQDCLIYTHKCSLPTRQGSQTQKPVGSVRTPRMGGPFEGNTVIHFQLTVASEEWATYWQLF